MIPAYDENGFLPHGVWDCTGKEFLGRFMGTPQREEYRQTLLNILDFASHYGAVSVLVGGSFVTSKENPQDIDCVVLFNSESQIPPRIESLDIEGNAVDIFFASSDQPDLVKSFLKLLTLSRFESKVGVVDINIFRNDKQVWDITWEPDEEIFEVVRRTYIRRHFVDKTRRNKTLVTIHGIRTHADWNAEIALNASANGWTIAPFQYGYVDATVFLQRKRRREIIDEFRDFLADITRSYGVGEISVIAHSFGTYIACNYILGFDDPPTRFDTLILCGAIVDENLDLNRFEGRAANIVNEKAPNDEWVEWAKIANLGMDEMFGYAGTRGFANPTERLWESESTIFTHNNVIRRDVVAQRWMPRLEANRGSVRREWWLKTIEEHVSKSKHR